MAGFIADVTPLRVSPAYRRLWAGTTVAQLGQQMAGVAVALQVYDITGSSFAVGMVGLASLGPLVVFGLYGGSIADAHDRRRVLLMASFGLWMCSMALLAQAWLDLRNVWLLYLVVAVQSGFFAVSNPARSAIIPRLVGPSLLPAANALSTASWTLGFTLGPLLAGVLVAVSGYAATFGVDVLTFTAALYAVARLPSVPPEGTVSRAGLRSVWEGLRFLRTRKNVLMTFLVDLAAMVLAQPRALYPALAVSVYSGGPTTVGVLSAAPAFGAFAGAVFSGWVGGVRWQGRMIVVMVMSYGAAVAAFGLSTSLWVGVGFLVVSGACDTVSSVFRSTILQVATPDDLRGRLQGVFLVVVAGGPRLGDAVAGTSATVFTLRIAIVAGGMACIAVTAMLAAHFRGFVRYDAENPVP
ncbi:MAG: MFS transporter [Actinomycetes bacterium]